MVAQAGGQAVRLGPASVTDTHGQVFVADGKLQDALIPPRWGYAGRDGSFAVFVDRFARGPLRLQALPGRAAPGALVRRAAGPPSSPAAAAVSSPHGVRVIRSVAATAGWSATWHPRGGGAAPLAVRRDGLVQAVNVPAGQGVLTWHYRPPGFRTGFALSLGATVLIILLLVSGLLRSRPGRPPEVTWDPGKSRRAVEPVVSNGLPIIQPVFRSCSYGGAEGHGQEAEQGGWDGAGRRHDLVQGSGLPARAEPAWLRDLARGRAAGAAPGAVAGDAGGLVGGVVPVHRSRGARQHRPSRPARGPRLGSPG